MTELERRAMLGDIQAQEECTEKGIVLPCKHCGQSKAALVTLAEAIDYGKSGKWYKLYSEVPVYACDFSKGGCGNFSFNTDIHSKKEALRQWNVRPVPPIGRCKECAQKEKATVNAKGFLICPVSGMVISDYDFCSYFQSIPSPEQ